MISPGRVERPISQADTELSLGSNHSPRPGEIVQLSLFELADIANREHALAVRSAVGLVEHAITAGEALIEAKAQLAHGAWLPWLAANFDGHENTAGNYMRLARNSQHVRNLDEPGVRKALDAIAGKGKIFDPDGDEWFTPRWVFDGLGLTFDIDACAPSDLTHVAVPARRFITKESGGLWADWQGLVWCNPPYSDPAPWASRMVDHHNGLLLTHIPMNAEWAVEVLESCDGLRLFQAMEFIRPDGSPQRPGYWLVLAAFGDEATGGLARLDNLDEPNPRRRPSPMLVRA